MEIYFPSLGLHLNPSRVAFSIGGKEIYWYGIIIAVGFLVAVGYAIKRADQFGLTEDDIIDMLLWAVPLGVIGARLYYCIFSWDLYKDNPISILYIWEGGLAIYGGVLGSMLGVFISTKIHKIPTGAMLDIGGLGLLIGQCIGRWGNFFNREAYGAATNSFLRMGLGDGTGSYLGFYHPTFFYESMWNLLGFIILHFASKKRRFDGELFIKYLCWYGLGRVFIEGLRMDSLYLGNTNLRVSQLLAGIFFVCTACFLLYSRVFKEYDPDRLLVNRRTAEKAAAEAAAAEGEAAEETADVPAEETDAPETETASAEEPADEAPEAEEETAEPAEAETAACEEADSEEAPEV